MNDKIRKLAIALLDDEDGINGHGYELLAELLSETNNKDILTAVNAVNGRYFIGCDDAETLLKENAHV